MEHLTIGKVARRSGTAIETIRFYEREGLIDKPARSSAGYRHYRADAVARLRFIRQAKELGFSLREVKELLSLRATPGKSCGDVKARARQNITDIERRIASLTRMKRALVKLAVACSGKGPLSACPILEALEAQDMT